MSVLSVVCARAGSKGLANKCIARLGGLMVAEYAIEYSLSLGSDVRTVVSTDIAELIAYCNKRDIACVTRDPRYCSDESRIEDALADAIEKYGKNADWCSLVYGNIPTRYPRLFHEAMAFLQSHDEYDSVLSMQNVEKFHPAWMFDYNSDAVPREKEQHYRRQLLPQKMIHDGHTVLFKSSDFIERYAGRKAYDNGILYSIFGNTIKPLMNDEVIIDIDTQRDLKLAQAFICSSARA